MLYAWMYPESIHRSAMLAVNPPGHFVWEPEVIDEQIAYYSDLCAQDAKCSARTDDLAATIRELSQDMPDRWLGLPINRGMVLAATFQSLSYVDQAPMALDVWLAAGKGDYSGMVLLTLAGPTMFAEAAVWGDNAAKTTSAGEYDLGIDYSARFNPPDSIIGSPFSTLAAGWERWPAKLIPEELRKVQTSDVETLLVSGSIDFLTPAQFATEELLPSLSNGRQVVLSEFGHSGNLWSLQRKATERLLASFYDTGVADDSLFTYQPWEFKMGLGFPAMAKLIVAAIVLLIAIVVTVAWYIAHRVRRRKVGQVSN